MAIGEFPVKSRKIPCLQGISGVAASRRPGHLPARPCFSLHPPLGIEAFQQLNPDLFLPRARTRTSVPGDNSGCRAEERRGWARIEPHRRRAWFETRSGFAGALLTMTQAYDDIKKDRHPEEAAKRPSRRTHARIPGLSEFLPSLESVFRHYFEGAVMYLAECAALFRPTGVKTEIGE